MAAPHHFRVLIEATERQSCRWFSQVCANANPVWPFVMTDLRPEVSAGEV